MEVVGEHRHELSQFEGCPTQSIEYMLEQRLETEVHFARIRWVRKQVFIVKAEIRIFNWMTSLLERFDALLPKAHMIICMRTGWVV